MCLGKEQHNRSVWQLECSGERARVGCENLLCAKIRNMGVCVWERHMCMLVEIGLTFNMETLVDKGRKRSEWGCRNKICLLSPEKNTGMFKNVNYVCSMRLRSAFTQTFCFYAMLKQWKHKKINYVRPPDIVFFNLDLTNLVLTTTLIH